MNNKMNHPLITVDGATLMSQPLHPPNFVVDALLSQGLHLLAGSPKVGKSWLALWLAVTVAKGESVWNRTTRQGTTLYLCLEDSVLRIQNRLFEITEDAPNSVHFCTECALIGQGLEEQVETFLAAHPDTVLVIIDTLQMVRPIHDATYANDYRDLSVLKRLTSTASPFFSFIICARRRRRMCSTGSPAPRPSAVRWIPASLWWRKSGAAAERNSPVSVGTSNTGNWSWHATAKMCGSWSRTAERSRNFRDGALYFFSLLF